MPAWPLGTNRHGGIVLLVPAVEFSILPQGVVLTACLPS